MTSTCEELETKIVARLAAAHLTQYLEVPFEVEEFGGRLSLELILKDAAQVESVRRTTEAAIGDSDVYLVVRSRWSLHKVLQPQVAYGPNGSPKAAVLVPVLVRSGSIEVEVTVAITKLAEMSFERILGTTPDLRRIATSVIEGALKLGGTSSWNPAERDYFEVASNAVADLSRVLRKTA